MYQIVSFSHKVLNKYLFYVDGGSSLLCNPSSALQKLTSSKDSQQTVGESNDVGDDDPRGIISLLQRPVMQFILQQHDLKSLKFAMRQALRWVFDFW